MNQTKKKFKRNPSHNEMMTQSPLLLAVSTAEHLKSDEDGVDGEKAMMSMKQCVEFTC